MLAYSCENSSVLWSDEFQSLGQCWACHFAKSRVTEVRREKAFWRRYVLVEQACGSILNSSISFLPRFCLAPINNSSLGKYGVTTINAKETKIVEINTDNNTEIILINTDSKSVIYLLITLLPCKMRIILIPGPNISYSVLMRVHWNNRCEHSL